MTREKPWVSPPAIQLGFKVITVVHRPATEMGANVAVYHTHTGLIEITAGLPPAEEFEALMHELLHAGWAARRLRDGDDEERVVTSLADVVTELFLRNPDLRAYADWVARSGG